MSDSSCGSLEGFVASLDMPEFALTKATRVVMGVIANASGPSVRSIAPIELALPAYVNPATAPAIVVQPIRRSSRQPVRRYSPEDWPYEPEADCQKDWDDAGE